MEYKREDFEMDETKKMRLYKFLYLLGYEMVEVDQVVNDNIIDIIYDAKQLFKDVNVRRLMYQVKFRKWNAEEELGIKITTYNELLKAEDIING